MSGQLAGAGSKQIAALLVRRSTRSVRALASTEGGLFGAADMARQQVPPGRNLEQ
jgi:hypothetical protein